MKQLLVVLFINILSLQLIAQNNLSALIPMPNEISLKDSNVYFTVDGDRTFVAFDSEELSFAAEKLQEVIYRNMHEKVDVSKTGKGELKLILDHSLKNKEQYIIDVTNSGLVIRGASKGAVFYGVVTLDQILMGDICMTAQNQVRGIYINDIPRFGYRAIMLDPARNFLSVESLKFFIDKMAQFKYNVLQLHLTDDQGWRIYIEKYPGLASKDHYTKKDLEEIISYAENRNVMVVPELDIPGHTSAMLSAFPKFKCANKDSVLIKVGETVNMMLCASVDEVYCVIDDIIKEVSEIFPAKYIHLGGDEAAIVDNWAKCPRCIKLMGDLGYCKPSQLMTYFFGKVIKSVKGVGKQVILWCELDNIYMPVTDYLFPYPKEVVLVSWRGGLTSKCLEFTRNHGNFLIMAPGEYAYLDYPQYIGDFPEFNNWGMPVTTLETCYQFDPGYGQLQQNQNHIMGIMGTLWGEAIKDINRATYMAYPRGLALAEAGWTDMRNRSWESFKNRMYPNIMSLMKQGVSVRVPFEIKQKINNSK